MSASSARGRIGREPVLARRSQPHRALRNVGASRFGDLTISNAANYNISLRAATGWIRDVTILNGYSDGIDPEALLRNVRISRVSHRIAG